VATSAGTDTSAFHGDSLQAPGLNFLDDIFGVSGVASVVDDDSETVGSEAFGDGGANST
jgi:hypothetical protein